MATGLSISSYISQVVAGQPRKPSPIHDALQAIQNWASSGLVDGDISASAGIAISKTTLAGVPLLRMNATQWTKVLGLTGVGTTADTDLDLTATTSATATAAMLLVRVISGNVTNATYVSFRKKGDTAGDGYWSLVYAPPTNNYQTMQLVTVPLDVNRKLTYNINANAGSFTTDVWVVGYFQPQA